MAVKEALLYMPSRPCAEASPDLREIGGVDILLVLGKNLGEESTRDDIRHKNNTRRLSLETKINVRGALQLVNSGRVRKAIIFSGGFTAGKDMPSEGQAMFDYYYARAPENGPHIILEEESFDTSTNAKKIRERLEGFVQSGDLGLKARSSIGLVTVGFHLERAINYCNTYGVSISWWGASEDLLAQEGRRYSALTARYLSSERVRKEEEKEERRLFVQRYDPKGRIPQVLHKFGWRG